MELEGKLLTLQETAKILKVNRNTIHKLITENGLPAFKIGGRWRIHKDKLNEWVLQEMDKKIMLKDAERE